MSRSHSLMMLFLTLAILAAAVFFAHEAVQANRELLKEKQAHLKSLEENNELRRENIDLQQKYLDSIKAQIKLTERLIQR